MVAAPVPEAPALIQPDPEWLRDPEVVKLFQSLPVQEGGRIKPLDTYARFLLLRLHGKQSLSISTEHKALPGVKKLKAIEWLLLSWFRPDIARDLPLFVVDNSQAVGEIGVDPKELRDRYSWNEIVKGREKLIEQAQTYGAIDEDKRSGIQRIVIDLARNFTDYDAVSDLFTSSRTGWNKQLASFLPPEFYAEVTGGAAKPLTVWEVAAKLGPIIRAGKLQALGPEVSNKLLQLFIDTTLRPAKTLAFLPPEDKANEAWLTTEQTITSYMASGVRPNNEAVTDENRGAVAQGDLDRSQLKDALYSAATSKDSFKAAAKTFVDALRAQAEKRGELKHVDREVRFYKADHFTYALVWYLLGFLVGIIGLVAPRTGWAKWTARIAWVALILGLGYNTWGIVERCIINERPPIATLYETIIFIAACIALVGLFIERVTKAGIGITVAGFVGALGMFVSMRFMALDGRDTMPTLEAVLITNFWLATHVTCINIGYAGALLGSIVSMVYVCYRAFVRGPQVVDIRRLLSRITYGIVCFGLLFSLVGTVLGGIWANDSWGRFWGWDPKENGALMIVLMGLIILHARLGGYIREIGLHVLSIILGAITLFSWFGVNLLNIGLHTYGFIDGIWTSLITAWGIQTVFILVALWFWWQERAQRKSGAA